MTLKEYLAASVEAPGPPRGKGVESDWFEVSKLDLNSGLLWMGDPQCSWSEAEDDDCSIQLPPGPYLLLAKGIDYGGRRFVSRVRIVSEAAPDVVTLSEEIDDTGTDSGRLGFADCHSLRAAYAATCGDDDDEFLDMIEEGITGPIGVFKPDPDGVGELVYLRSGMGDGGGPVLQLTDETGNVVGVEHEFIDPNDEW